MNAPTATTQAVNPKAVNTDKSTRSKANVGLPPIPEGPVIRQRAHTGPFVIKHMVAKANPSHHVLMRFCRGSKASCPGCADAYRQDKLQRFDDPALSDLMSSFDRLEQHRFTTVKAFNAFTRKLLRRKAPGVIFHLNDAPDKNGKIDIRILTPGEFGGSALGDDRTKVIEALVRKAPLAFNNRPIRFNKYWPKPGKPETSYREVDSMDVDDPETFLQEAVAVLKSENVKFWHSLTWTNGQARTGLHFWLPTEILSDPRKRNRLDQRLGSFGVSPKEYAA